MRRISIHSMRLKHEKNKNKRKFNYITCYGLDGNDCVTVFHKPIAIDSFTIFFVFLNACMVGETLFLNKKPVHLCSICCWRTASQNNFMKNLLTNFLWHSSRFLSFWFWYDESTFAQIQIFWKFNNSKFVVCSYTLSLIECSMLLLVYSDEIIFFCLYAFTSN